MPLLSRTPLEARALDRRFALSMLIACGLLLALVGPARGSADPGRDQAAPAPAPPPVPAAAAPPAPGLRETALSPAEGAVLQRSLDIEDHDLGRPVEAAEKLRSLLDELEEVSPLRRELLGMVGRMYANAEMAEAAESVAAELDARQRAMADGSDLAAATVRLRLQARRHGAASIIVALRALQPRIDAELSLRERLRYWFNRGTSLASLAEFGEAVHAFQTASELADQLGRPGWKASVRSSHANVLSQLGQHRRAVAMASEALSLARDVGDDVLLSDTYTTLGVVLDNSGDSEGLREAMQSAIVHARRAGDRTGLSVLLGNVAHYHLVRSEYAEAEQVSQEALDVAEQAEDIRGRSLALVNLGLSRIGLGRVEEGKALVARSLEYDALEGLRNEMALTQAELGAALERAGDLAGAVDALHAARRLQDEIFREDQQRAVLALQEEVEAKRREKVIQQLEGERALKAAEVERNRLQQWVWRLLAALLALALALVAMGLKRLRDSNRRLAGLNAQLRLQSERDPLTGLANRRHVQAVVDHASAGGAFRGTLMLIDLDHFKQINDRHGHAVGDAILVETARRLRSICRERDLAARWGGEEFLLLLDRLSSNAASHLAARLLVELARPVTVEGQRLPISASVGYAVIPLPPADLELPFEQALRLVDASLYLAKLRGRNRACGIAWLRGDTAGKLESVIADIEHAEALGRVGLDTVLGEEGNP